MPGLKMGNLLTHGLLAGAIMAGTNLAFGIEPISWNVFLAAMISITMSLDSGDGRISPGSPAFHSLGGCLAIMYLAGVVSYILWSLAFINHSLAIALFLAVSIGALSHLTAEMMAGEQVFTFPRNLRPETWLVGCDSDSDRFWPSWGRFLSKRRKLGDAHINAFSLTVIILSIGLS